jgi:hypothetical protein
LAFGLEAKGDSSKVVALKKISESLVRSFKGRRSITTTTTTTTTVSSGKAAKCGDKGGERKKGGKRDPPQYIYLYISSIYLSLYLSCSIMAGSDRVDSVDSAAASKSKKPKGNLEMNHLCLF